MVATQAPEITIDALVAALDETWAWLEPIVSQYGPVLDAGPDAGFWTPRQLLSHLIGALQRVPVHAGFFLDDDDARAVTIFGSDPYWIAEWGTAPFASFLLAMQAAVEGNKAFLRALDPAMLARTRRLPVFGVERPLGDFLLPVTPAISPSTARNCWRSLRHSRGLPPPCPPPATGGGTHARHRTCPATIQAIAKRP